MVSNYPCVAIETCLNYQYH